MPRLFPRTGPRARRGAAPTAPRPRLAEPPPTGPLASILFLAALLSPGPAPLAAQSALPETGAVPAALLLRQLDGVKRVLVIGAHPDDEDTALLAALARRWGARAAYLSLTRGEGGQNLIGPELDEALGILRTGELLAARRLDGAEQYFTRAYDFGYSRSAEVTFRRWPRDSLLADVVWVIRTFRPQVVVSVFGGTPQDGHGQHQAAGILAREAFHAAGDPSRFPEQLDRGARPWAPMKLYRRTWRDPERATLAFETGRLDPVLGRSHYQLAMESRSQHRSQDFGTAQPPGPRATRLRLLESGAAGPDTSLFAGVDTTLAGLADVPGVRRGRLLFHIRAYREAVREAMAALNALAPEAAAPALARALEEARRAAETAEAAGGEGRGAAEILREKERLAQEALLAASAVTLLLRADDQLVVPGQAVGVAAEVWNGGPFHVTVEEVSMELPGGWSAAAAPPRPPGWRDGGPPGDAEEAGASEAEREGAPVTEAGRVGEASPERGARRPDPGAARDVGLGEIARWGFRVSAPPDASPSEPYYLERERTGDLYRWPDEPALWGLPRSPPVLWGAASLTLTVGATRVPLWIARPVRYRGVDKARGEFWRPLLVAPALSVEVEPEVLVWGTGEAGMGDEGTGDTGPRAVAVRLRGQGAEPVAGQVALELPAGWTAEPREAPFRLEGRGATADFAFRLRPPGGAIEPGGAVREEFRIRAVARADDGRTYRRGFRAVDYPHIDPALHFREAETRLLRFPVRVERRRVGYVMGSGDRVPEAIRQLGLEVELLEPRRLREGDFEGLDVVVLGIRAYEVRPDLEAANPRLLEWVRGGGTLIVQYNKYELVEGGFAPYPVEMARPHDRVTEETAPVELLEPEAPVFHRPNRIAERDFDGWVQERGLYFLREWNSRFLPLLATADPGEEWKRGALLVAPVGDGLYAYTGLAFFRQLPAGVPGAYRLFANLLSVEPAVWRAYLERRGPGR